MTKSAPQTPAVGTIRSGLVWMFSSQGVLSAMQLLVLVVLARLLGPAEFGVATVFLAVTQVGGVMASLGLGPALVQSATADHRHLAAAYKVVLVAGLTLGLGLLALRDPLADLLNLVGHGGAFAWFVPMLVASGLQTLTRSSMQRAQRFREMTLVETTSYLIAFALPATLLASRGYGPLALLVAFTLNQGANVLAFTWLLKPPLRTRLDRAAVRELGRNGLGFGLTEMVSMLAQSFDRLLVAGLLGQAAVGIYGRASTLMQTGVQVLSAPIDAVMFPAFSRVQADQPRLRELYRKTLVLVTLLVLPAGLVMIAAPEGIVLLLLGSAWADAAPLLQVFGILLMIRGHGRAVDFVLRARGLVMRRLGLTLFFSACMFAFISWGAGRGLTGVAWGITGAFAIHFLVSTWLAVREMSMGWQEFLSMTLPVLVWAVVLGGLLLWCRPVVAALVPHVLGQLLVASTLVVAIFAGCLWFGPRLIFGSQGERANQMLGELLGRLRDLCGR